MRIMKQKAMKKETKYLIIGAGIGGLSAAAYLKEAGIENFLIVEKSKSVPNNLANGLHYLHDVDFRLPFPMDFKKCILTENIWDTKTNTFSQRAMLPDLFEYSKKVMDNLRHPSSIMDPGKMTNVFVPESNDMNELIKKYEEYIGAEHFIFGRTVQEVQLENKKVMLDNMDLIEYEYMISTCPMNVFFKIAHIENEYELKHKTLFITNYKTTNIVPNWLIVLYMSDPKFPPYRLTCFNNQISLESLSELTANDEVIIKYIVSDLFDYDPETVSKYAWETGRIFGINKAQRKAILEDLSKHGVFPIGRFGLWNGKLRIDDTIEQAECVVNNLLATEQDIPRNVCISKIIDNCHE